MFSIALNYRLWDVSDCPFSFKIISNFLHELLNFVSFFLFLSLPFHYTIRLFLFELEIYLCCNNKTVIIVEFFRMYILNDKEINRASLMICISIDGKVSAPSIFFFLPINRINSIIYTHTHTKSMMMTLIFIIKLMYMTYWTLNYSFTQRNDEFSYPSILIYIYAFVGTLNFLYSDNDY